MKLRKLLALAMAAVLAVSSASVAVADGPDGLFELNGDRYGSLAEALGKVENDQTATITLRDNYTGGGAKIEGTGKNITIDLNGFTYTVGEPTVGSAGTETNGFQLLKDNTVRFKDGTIKASDYKKLKIVFQNYCDLTLENVTVDARDASQVQYVASNNNGSLRIEGASNIYAPDGACAFDVYYWPKNSYTDGVAVTIDTTGEIVGNIEYGSDRTDSENTPTKATITIENGTIDGDLSMTDSTSLDDAGISVNGGQFTDEKWINENYTGNADLIVKIDDGGVATYYAGDDSDAIPAPDESSVTIMKAENGSATVTGEGVKVTNDTKKELTVNNQSIPAGETVEISPAPVTPTPDRDSDNDDGGDYFGNETWDEVKREIAEAEEGDTIKVSATGLPYFPSSVARALKGLDITLEVRKNGVTYEVNGLEIGDIDKIWYEFDELETELLTADADSETSSEADTEAKPIPDTGR